MPQRRAMEIGPEALVGGKIAPETQALKGMRELERELARDVKDGLALKKLLAARQRPLQEALGSQAGDGAAATAKGLAALDGQLRRRRVPAPAPVRDAPRIFTGSIGATRTTPFDYQWTWTAQNGGARAVASADRLNGQINIDSYTNGVDSTGWCRAAVGIYFRPVVANGILRISANPAFTYNWFTICTLASAHSDAFIGLYVGRYTLAGGFDGAPVNQMTSLWNDDSWWSGSWSNKGSNSGFPLFAQLNVDSAHWYAIWVWTGGSADGAGWGTFSGSGANSVLRTTVPSITWELF